MKFAIYVFVFWFGPGIFRAALSANLYIPPQLNPSTARMLVVIHGCLQSAESMAFGTGWNQLAEKNNFVVLYPQVPVGTNPLDCWSWYNSENQRVDSGQLKGIVDQIQSTRKMLGLTKGENFVTGISSGGATAAGLLACFPEMFAAGAIHSGPSYGLAQSMQDANKVLKDGPPPAGPSGAPCRPREFAGSVMVIQGKKDLVVNPKNALRIISDFIGETEPLSRENFGDGKNLYSVSDFKSSRRANGRLVEVSDLDHAWSGSVHNLKHATLLGPNGRLPTKIPFFSELGPSATNLIWEFFAQSTRTPETTAPITPSESKRNSKKVK